MIGWEEGSTKICEKEWPVTVDDVERGGEGLFEVLVYQCAQRNLTCRNRGEELGLMRKNHRSIRRDDVHRKFHVASRSCCKLFLGRGSCSIKEKLTVLEHLFFFMGGSCSACATLWSLWFIRRLMWPSGGAHSPTERVDGDVCSAKASSTRVYFLSRAEPKLGAASHTTYVLNTLNVLPLYFLSFIFFTLFFG